MFLAGAVYTAVSSLVIGSSHARKATHAHLRERVSHRLSGPAPASSGRLSRRPWRQDERHPASRGTRHGSIHEVGERSVAHTGRINRTLAGGSRSCRHTHLPPRLLCVPKGREECQDPPQWLVDVAKAATLRGSFTFCSVSHKKRGNDDKLCKAHWPRSRRQ